MRKKITLALLVILSIGLFSSHVARAGKKGYADFRCFYTAGKRFAAGENIYVARDKEAAEFRYAPAFAMIMAGLSFMGERQADTAWYLINFLLLAITLAYLKKLFIPDNSPNAKKLFWVYFLAILAAIRFILHNFDNGQSNILMLFCMASGLYYISKNKTWVGGALFAFSCMIKYTPLIFIPYFILKKKFKLSLIIVGCIGLYLMLPALCVGFKTNLIYLKSLLPFLTSSTIFDQMTILDPKNQSLYSAVTRIFTNCVLYFYAPPMPFSRLNLSQQNINLIFAALAGTLYAASLFKKGGTLANYALLAICVALFNLNAWMHSYILLLPAYFIIAYYLVRDNFKDKTAAGLAALVFILNFITVKAFAGKTLAYKLCFYSPFTLGALAAFLILLKIKGEAIEKKSGS